MIIADFINQYNGQKNVSYDGVPDDAGQCVQLVELYARDVLGLVLPVYPDAATYWEQDVPGYIKVGVAQGPPLIGDIVVWNRNSAGSGGHGHIDICIGNPSTSGFLGLDSNWSPLTVSEVQHNYTNISGYLRRQAMQPVPTPQEVLQQFRTFQGSDPTQAQIDYYTKPDKGYAALNGDLLQEVFNEYQALKNSPQSINKQSVEDYITKNLQ